MGGRQSLLVKYLQEYKEFFSSIDDPLERLDDLEVQLEDLEIASDQMHGSHEFGGISGDEFQSKTSEINSFIEWAKLRFLIYNLSIRI